MIYCQSCLTPNPDDVYTCVKCGASLFVLGGNQQWTEAEPQRISMDDHFLERISNLEETVNHVLDHLNQVANTLETVDRNGFVTRSGLIALVETLKESRLLREDILYQRWEATMAEQMEVAESRERFSQMKSRFRALYRGKANKKSSFLSLIDEADFLIYSDQFPECMAALAQALQMDPLNYELAFYLAEYNQEQGLDEEAREFLQIALQGNPEHNDSLLMLALLTYGEGNEEAAKSYLKRCLDLNPFNLVALISMGAILTSEGHIDEAEPLLHRVLDMGPQPQAHYLLGKGAKEKGKLNRAIKHLKAAIELDPEHDDAVFTLGMAYLARGWTRKARDCFELALELNPYPSARAAEVEEPPQTGEPDALDEDNLEHLDFAETLFREGKYKQALSNFRQLLKRHPANIRLLTGISALNFAMRRYDEVLKHVRKIISIEAPETIQQYAYTLEMEAFRALGLYEEALGSLNEMIEAFPNGPGRAIAGYGMAMTLADMDQDLKGAEEIARHALELSPLDFRHNILDALGWVLFKQGRFEEALELVESALSMQETVNHLHHYGMILLALDLKEEAFKAFERTVDIRERGSGLEEYLLQSYHGQLETGEEQEMAAPEIGPEPEPEHIDET